MSLRGAPLRLSATPAQAARVSYPVEEMTMNRYLQSALVAALGVASVTCALAQENPSPPSNPQDPTSTTTTAPPASSTEPYTTSSSSRQAAAESKDTQKQMMKDCVAKEQANGTGVSASQAKKTCKAQMKSSSSTPKNY